MNKFAIQKSYLPSITTLITENKGCHRFISTSCLDLKNKNIMGKVKLYFKPLTLFILMDYPIHIDTITTELSISYFKGLLNKISIK